VAEQVLLWDLVAIPDTVHDGDFVLNLAKGVQGRSTITDYVVTEPLAANFDRALDLIKSALETGASRAAYLNGSFDSGKSHFMAVLHAILKGDPDARGKKGLADVVAKHDKWLQGRKFLLVPYHLPDSQSLDAAILGGYVAHVTNEHPDKPLPAVYRDDNLIADAKDARARQGDAAFIASLPATDPEAEQWGVGGWDEALLDQAFREPAVGETRRRLVGDLLTGPFKRYAATVHADQASYIEFDEGLSTLPVGQLMPLGAIFDVLAHGADRSFSDKLRDEFETAKKFLQPPRPLGTAEEERPHRGAGPQARPRASVPHPAARLCWNGMSWPRLASGYTGAGNVRSPLSMSRAARLTSAVTRSWSRADVVARSRCLRRLSAWTRHSPSSARAAICGSGSSAPVPARAARTWAAAEAAWSVMSAW
jgi:hypothetical protein